MNLAFKHILIVDDCEVTGTRLAKELSAQGYIVENARDGVQALKLLEEQSFDFLLTDWDMPNMDGQTLCQCVRARKLEQYIYIIMMTGHSESIDAVAGLTAGADDFIVKPLDTRELSARLMNGSRILKLDRSLTTMATQDPLTGALNRRTFVSGIKSQIELSRRRGKPLTCIMLDLDHFKQLNDNFGHIAGDIVLVSVAEVLQRQFRTSDFIFRYGGEEFAIILSGADEAGAVICAERCRQEISELRLRGHEKLRVTASCGIATVESLNMTPMELTEQADLALRTAKQLGRNRTVCYSDCCAEAPSHKEDVAPTGAAAPAPNSKVNASFSAADEFANMLTPVSDGQHSHAHP